MLLVFNAVFFTFNILPWLWKFFLFFLFYRLANEDMRFESKRYQSYGFCSPNKHWPSPEKLSAAGFYYVDDKIGMKCFCCNAVIEGWESAEQCPLKKHRYTDNISDTSILSLVMNFFSVNIFYFLNVFLRFWKLCFVLLNELCFFVSVLNVKHLLLKAF